MVTRRWMLKIGALLGGSYAVGATAACSATTVGGEPIDGGTGDASTSPYGKPTCGYGYGAYGYGYGYGRSGYGYGYGYGCRGYGYGYGGWSAKLERARRLMRSGPSARDLARG